jgi:hypothetical protein
MERVIDTNRGRLPLHPPVARDMLIRRWGRIVNIVSASGTSAPSASQTRGVEGRPDWLTRTLAREFARRTCWCTPCRPD